MTGPTSTAPGLRDVGITRPTIVLDCRWLTFSGAGRVTESLLRGLQALAPPQRWVLWGPAAVAAHLWPGAAHVLASSDPRQLRGQREWFAIPAADLVVFLHQQRPLRQVPALTMVLDTTPLRYNKNRLDAWTKERFLHRVGRVSKGILTISDFSVRCIERDLKISPARVTKVGLPADRDLARRVLAARAVAAQEAVALYVGLFLPHKNLARLIEAFGRTTFRQQGGTLLLVGGKDAAEPLRQSLDPEQRGYVTIRAHCSQTELERLYATSRLLVQPSLEEGFGLPVQEALACGLPACVSNGGALPEVTRGFAEHFDPTSVPDMARAIDATTARTGDPRYPHGQAMSEAFLALTPTTTDLAQQVLDAVEQHLPWPG